MQVRIVYGSNVYPLEEGLDLSIGAARDVLHEFFPEVDNAEAKVSEADGVKTIEFVKKSGRLG